MIEYLSYNISEDTPLYGNSKGIIISADKQIQEGDSCNTLNFQFSNHTGTHIDFPRHFDASGKTINDYNAEFWQFDNIEVIDLSGKINDSEIIGTKYFENLTNKTIDLLLIKTGYGKFRSTKKYTITPPGISSKLAPFFRKKFPNLRCIGMDLISISSYANREEGRKAHHAFLNSNEGSPILLLEDMKLDSTGPFSRVIIAPLLLDKADGAPCTVFGFKK